MNEGATTSFEGVVHRLHPLTLLLETVRFLKNWGIPVLVVVLVAGAQGETPWWFYPALASAGVTLGVSWLRVLTLRFGFEADSMVVREGLVFRRRRIIPAARVQNVHVRSGLLDRFVGVAEVRVETAAPGEADARLDVLRTRTALEFKAALLARRTVDVTDQLEDSWTLVRASTTGDLLLAGATESRIGAIVAAVFALLQGIDDLGEAVKGMIKSSARELSATVGVDGPMLAGALTIVVLLFGWLTSIGWSLVTWHRFALWRLRDQLRIVHGLLTHIDASLPLTRVQTLRLEANWFRRRLGVLALRADAAGSAQDHEGAGTAMLVPLLRREESAAIAATVFPGLNLLALAWRPASRRAVAKGMLLGIPVVAVAAAGAIAVDDRFLGFCMAGALVLTLAGAWLRARALGHAVDPSFVAVRAGVWLRRCTLVPLGRIQEIRITASPLQRMLDLRTVRVTTAGGSSLAAPRIEDLDSAIAEQLASGLWSSVNGIGESGAGL